jgi:hypothetical protein
LRSRISPESFLQCENLETLCHHHHHSTSTHQSRFVVQCMGLPFIGLATDEHFFHS